MFVIYRIFCCFAYFFFHGLHPVYTLTYPLFYDVTSPSYLNLPYLALPYPILSYPILSYPILSYPILSYPILSYPILSYPTSHTQDLIHTPHFTLPSLPLFVFPSLLYFIIQFTLSSPYPTLPYKAIFYFF